MHIFWSKHYKVDLKQHSVDLTEEGVALAEMILETDDLWDEDNPWARFHLHLYTSSFALAAYDVFLLFFPEFLCWDLI